MVANWRFKVHNTWENKTVQARDFRTVLTLSQNNSEGQFLLLAVVIGSQPICWFLCHVQYQTVQINCRFLELTVWTLDSLWKCRRPSDQNVKFIKYKMLQIPKDFYLAVQNWIFISLKPTAPTFGLILHSGFLLPLLHSTIVKELPGFLQFSGQFIHTIARSRHSPHANGS